MDNDYLIIERHVNLAHGIVSPVLLRKRDAAVSANNRTQSRDEARLLHPCASQALRGCGGYAMPDRDPESCCLAIEPCTLHS